jgi:hypothetical protein
MVSRRYLKPKPIPLIKQKLMIQQVYSNIENCFIHNSELQCILHITPSAHSQLYRVKIFYKLRERPKAILLSPQLQIIDGKRPPHLYPDDKKGNPCLCVYTPSAGEWDIRGTQLIAHTFIPWISTWLNTYEYWVITGNWHYPGNEPKISNKRLKHFMRECATTQLPESGV